MCIYINTTTYFSRSEFIISSCVRCACITWTAGSLSQMQNFMRHKSLYEYTLGVRQWRHVTLRRGAFCVSRQHRLCADDQRISCVIHERLMYLFIYETIICNRWITSNFPSRWHRTTSKQVAEILHFQPRILWRTPTKIHQERRRRRQQEAAHKAQRTSLSTAKVTSSTQRPQTCTDAAT